MFKKVENALTETAHAISAIWKTRFVENNSKLNSKLYFFKILIYNLQSTILHKYYLQCGSHYATLLT